MSNSCFDREGEVFRVLVNSEDQYSIWPEWKPVPGGWRDVGVTGDKAACLSHIETVWTDMRPASLRRWMDERAAEALATATHAPQA